MHTNVCTHCTLPLFSHAVVRCGSALCARAGQERLWSDAEVASAQAKAEQIEAEMSAKKPPPLNMGSISGASYKSYPITSTPRKELW